MDEYSTYEVLLERSKRSKPATAIGAVTIQSLDRAWTALVDQWNTEIGAVTIQSLDRAWTALVEQWNTEIGPVILQKREVREAARARLSLAELALQLCELSWEAIGNAVSLIIWTTVEAVAGTEYRDPIPMNGRVFSRKLRCRRLNDSWLGDTMQHWMPLGAAGEYRAVQ
ncbi:Hypothetical protein PHPALM_5851 [Phytophthora palmivora]|uniref:Uncharacterized protein n=1 Tax=Phytophthora palmivora TaxID=4796 RepID=A0A2P4YGE4_9STRA|nr:Hypothetical protein PHPALM_5851 [Phytophthora palmivora]